MGKLTDKQIRFCNEYLIDLNATQAAIRAGYSEKTANRIASENLSKLDIQQYLKKKQEEKEKRTEITADMVIKELAAIAFSDRTAIAKVRNEPLYNSETGNIMLDESGKVITAPIVEITETDTLSEDVKKAISGIKQGRKGIEISSYDKVKALELLGKHLGMFNEKQQDENADETVRIIDDV